MHLPKTHQIEILSDDAALARIFNPHREREQEPRRWPSSGKGRRSIRRQAIAAKRSFLDG